MDNNAIYERLYIPLSDDQIHKLLPDSPIIIYEDLEKYNSIEHLLPNKRSSVVLFVKTMADNAGHWCGLARSENNIYYFDSYGLRPDKALSFAPKELRKDFGQNIPLLSYLLNKAVDSGFDVSFNEVKYQDENPAIMTCGKWVVSRLNFNTYEVDNRPEIYKKLIEKYMKDWQLTSDLVICRLVPV